ncbi:MAG: DUF4838 domain-containing protein [Planctomycetes bacterium]|nr:DUF4838 domain-containing protein [Planctomycetota bacterium]
MKSLAWFAVSLALVASAPASGGEIQLAEDGKSDYVIVLPRSPSRVERTAARELQEHLLRVTGAKLPVVSEADSKAHPPSAPAILVGNTARAGKLVQNFDPAALGHDGILVKTVGRDLVLAGQPPRGTLYAVYTFLEDVVGCRWWTSSESFIPSKSTLMIPELDVEYAPPLRYREAYYRDAFNGVFAARLKCNGHAERIAEEYGGQYRFAGFVHTFYPLLPPEKYFKDHPEWYSEINGKRTTDHAQLCLTNEEMRQELVRNALARLRATPGANIISISQNDWHGRCQCERCLAVEKEEGSPSGPLLRFVNAVAAEIEKEFPDVLVETLAYQYTRQPPRHVRPRKNVIIRLCSIECSFVQPLGSGPQNEKFRKDIEGWSRIAPQLFVWDYVTNFRNYILPHPNLRVLAPNIRFFVKNHVVGLFEQGDSQCGIGDFVRMRAWLLAHLMWDPNRDEKALIREFLEGYYGPAAPYLQQYLDLLHDAAERSGVYLRCFMSDTSSWLTLDDLNTATRLYEQAMKAVADDPVLRRRVRRERLPLDHVWLKRYHVLRTQARLTGKPFLGPDDPAAACEEFIRLAYEHNVGNYRERHSFKEYEPMLRRLFRPAGPPPEPCRGLPADRWLDFQDNQFRLSKPGVWSSLVKDPNASDGMAARMPGSHRQWALQLPLAGDLKGLGRWRCYVVARCEGSAKDGLAMTMGLYDTVNRKGVASRRVSVEDSQGDRYRIFDLGTHELRGGLYFWVAPPERPGQIDAVYVDRIFIVREGGK